MGTVSVPSSTLCFISGVANWDICFLDRKRLEPKKLLWQHHSGCHFVSFVMHISRTLLQYFQKYHLFSILPFLVVNNMTSSLI